MQPIDQKNLILFIAFMFAILIGYQFYLDLVIDPQQEQQRQALEQAAPAPDGTATVPRPEGAQPQATAPTAGVRPRATVLAEAPRLAVDTAALSGSISLTGGRFDDLTLNRYKVTTAPDSPNINLLAPVDTTAPYFADFGWIDDAGAVYGGGGTAWQSDGGVLTPTSPVRLSYRAENGLRFERTVAIDENYMFTITQRLVNNGSEPVTLFPYGRVTRIGKPPTVDFYILHEGPMGVFDGTLKEYDYGDLEDDGRIDVTSTGGWIGITDKYWLAALVPDQQEEVRSRFTFGNEGGVKRYQVDYLGSARPIAPGSSVEMTNRLFAGAKLVRLMDRYRDELGIDRFDLAIDFGWFFYITKPLFYAILYLNDLLGNFGLAILALTVGVKLAFFPLANKSYKSMSKMKALQPQMTELKERHGDDRQKLQQEMMALYKREKVNPVSGCLPIAVQIPVFFALYKVLFVAIEMRHAPFYGWIRDLSAPDPTTIFNLFGLIPFDPPTFLMIGVWPLIMGITMFLQQKLNPAPPDPIQAKIFTFLPIIFTFILAGFPAGLVIYWAWNNALSILQQYVIMRRMGVPIGGGRVKQTT